MRLPPRSPAWYFVRMRHSIRIRILTALTSVLVAVPAFATSSSPVPEVTYRVLPRDVRGDSVIVRVRAVIPQGWHIQSNAPLDEFLIPTELKPSGDGLRFGKPVFPAAETKEFPALGGDVALFSDTLDITVTARATKGKRDAQAVAAALARASIGLRYQACNDTQCLAPRTVNAKRVK